MRYLSVCSGIGSDAVAWHSLGWETAAFAEIDGHASAVLADRFPGIPNHGDFTTIEGSEYGPVDLVTGGTPCQSFSIAGLRGGLDDDRGNLALEFCRLLGRVRPRWFVWENVPGVFSAATHDSPDPRPPPDYVAMGPGQEEVVSDEYEADETHALSCILAGFQELGYGFAYRTLDAQYVRVQSHPWAVPQRRRRLFVVGYLGDWRPPVAVLLEPEGLRGNPPPRREAGQGVAGSLSASLGRRCGQPNGALDQPLIAGAVSAKWAKGTGGPAGDECYNLVAHSLRAEGFDASEDGTGRGTPIIPFDTTQITSKANYSRPKPGDPCHPLAAGGHPPAIAFSCKDSGADAGGVSPTLRAMPHDKSHANAGGQVAVAFDARQDPCVYEEHTGAHGSKYPPHAVVHSMEVLGVRGNASEPLVSEGVMPTANSMMREAAVAVSIRGRDGGATAEIREGSSPAVRASQGGGDKPHVLTGMTVRRITPLEAERLMGLPDGWTAVPYRRKPMADGPRYRLIGNGIAINALRYIGERIALFERVTA